MFNLWMILFDDYILSNWSINYIIAKDIKYDDVKCYLKDEVDIEQCMMLFGDDFYLANKLKSKDMIKWYKNSKNLGYI